MACGVPTCKKIPPYVQLYISLYYYNCIEILIAARCNAIQLYKMKKRITKKKKRVTNTWVRFTEKTRTFRVDLDSIDTALHTALFPSQPFQNVFFSFLFISLELTAAVFSTKPIRETEKYSINIYR